MFTVIRHPYTGWYHKFDLVVPPQLIAYWSSHCANDD